MNYKIFILLLLFTFSCTNQNLSQKKTSSDIIFHKYSNNGFTLIYSDELFKKKIINKKLNDRELFVFQKNLKKNTPVKITNLLNNGEFSATINISLYLPLQCKTKLQPALKAWVVFFFVEYFNDFIDMSSDIIKFL